VSETKNDVREQSGPGTEELMERVREFVRVQLREGAEPCDLSFVLSYIATEMGLAIASNPVGVFPVVLEGIAKAAASRLEADSKPEAPAKEQPAVPSNRTLH
jgi:hypothetical protein